MGSEGDLHYVIFQADADTNPLGRVIQFDPAVFSSPQTILLDSALPDLSNATGLTDIEGPGAAGLTVARSSRRDYTPISSSSPWMPMPTPSLPASR